MLDADDCVAPGFVATAVRALEAHPDFDVVVPTAAYFESDEALTSGDYSGFATFVGDAPSLGLIENPFSCVTAVMRRSLFRDRRFDSRLDGVEDWNLFLRLALEGKRFLVTNDVQFFYRQRPGSVSKKNLHPEGHRRLLERLLERLPTPLPAHVRVSGLLLRGAPVIVDRALSEIPFHYKLADSVNRQVKRVPRLHSAVKKKAAAAIGWGEGSSVPLRHTLIDTVLEAVRRRRPS
jgi:hypothetical protein